MMIRIKTRRHLFALVTIGFFLVGSPALARDGAFLTPQELDLQTILPPPPADDSPQTKADLAVLHQIEDARTPDEAAHALADAEERDVFIYKTVLGDGFSAEKLPAVATFFAHVTTDASDVMGAAKKKFVRRRPYVNDPTLHPLEQEKSFSYPSGHSTQGWTNGIILISLVPSKRDAIFIRAQDYAHNRLVNGVHYPSDIAAGEVAASVIAVLMEQKPAFHVEYEAAKRELRQAGFK